MTGRRRVKPLPKDLMGEPPTAIACQDSRGYFEAGRHRTLGWGIWLHTLSPPSDRMVLRVDDPTAELGAPLDATATRLYFSVFRRESDVWTAEVVTR